MMIKYNPLSFFTFFAFCLSGMSATAQEHGGHLEYKTSSCYKEYEGVYRDAMKREVDNLRGRAEIMARTGVALSNTRPSTEGKSERSIVNAADLEVGYDENKVESRWRLNDFHYIHQRVLKDYPLAAPEQTRQFIRRGFATNSFCKKFWLFGSRYDKKDVSKYVLEQIKNQLESASIPDSHINDSELLKDSRDDDAEQGGNDSGAGASEI